RDAAVPNERPINYCRQPKGLRSILETRLFANATLRRSFDVSRINRDYSARAKIFFAARPADVCSAPDRFCDSNASTKQRVDLLGAEADLDVVRPAHRDVVVNVEMAGRRAVLVEPDQRTGDDEEHPHRVLVLIGHQRMPLAGRLVDEIAGRGGP